MGSGLLTEEGVETGFGTESTTGEMDWELSGELSEVEFSGV